MYSIKFSDERNPLILGNFQIIKESEIIEEVRLQSLRNPTIKHYLYKDFIKIKTFKNGKQI